MENIKGGSNLEDFSHRLPGAIGKRVMPSDQRAKRGIQKFSVLATDADTLDITDAQQVKNVVERENPDVIINTAAYTKVDACETDELDCISC